jgi:hypothetical protein
MVKQELEIIYVTDYYDIPLSGLCRYNNRIERFEYNEENQEYHIIHLTRYQRIVELFRKKLFEICVGTHQSYVNNKKPSFFYWRKPVILHRILFKLYYGIKRVR